MTEREEYLLRHGMALAAEVDSRDLWHRLFSEIEEEGFLLRQAQLFQDFEPSSQQLERFALPALVRAEDWDRFLHYCLVAANLRGLAESVAGGEILPALVRSGHRELADGLAARLPSPLGRARARAAIARELDPADPAFGAALDGVMGDLDRVQPPIDHPEAEVWCATLEAVAEPLAPVLRRRWAPWVERLQAWPELAGRAWLAVGEGFLRQGLGRDPDLWEALRRAGSPDDVVALVAAPDSRRVLRSSPWEALDRIRSLPGVQGVAFWTVAVALLADGAERGEAAAETLRLAVARFGEVAFAREVVERGVGLWTALSADDRHLLAGQITEPELRASLFIAVLESGVPEGSAASAAIHALPAGPVKLHLTLRWLVADPELAADELRRWVVAIARYLAEVRYAVPAADLCRFLDLVARTFPLDLRRMVENALWSPASGSETLETLVASARRRELLAELLTRAEPYAAAVAPTEAEGFKLRRRVLIRLTCRLCTLDGTLDAFDQTVPRLLAEEEDELRAELARALTAADRLTEAEDLCAGIRRRRDRLLALLRVYRQGEIPPNLLTFGALYEAVADVGEVTDEQCSLAALAQPPFDPKSLAATVLAPLESRARRVEALVDLARHALRFQEEAFPPGRRDLLAAVLPLKEALGVVESETWLLALTPDVVAVGARLGVTEAAAELEEAISQVLELESASWECRAETVEALLAAVPSSLGDDGTSPHRGRSAERSRLAARLIRWIADLPRTMPPGAPRDAVRESWHRLFPQLEALRLRLPHQVSRYLEHPLRAWLVYQGAAWLSAIQGVARCWRALERMEGWLLPRWLRERWQTPWGQVASDQESEIWDWVTPEQQVVLGATVAFASAGSGVVERLEERLAATPGGVEALAYLFSATNSSRVPGVVSLLPSGERRDRLGLRLLRHRWLTADPGLGVVKLLSELQRRWEGLSWQGLEAGSRPAWWLAAIRQRCAAAQLDPGNPATAPLRRKLWDLAADHGCLAALARGALGGLGAGGKEGAERGLRLFLNAYLAPRLGGEAAPETQERLAAVAAAASRALSLGRLEQRADLRGEGWGSPGTAPPSSRSGAGGVGDPPRGGSVLDVGESEATSSSSTLLAISHAWRRALARSPLALGWWQRRARENLGGFALAIALLWALALLPLDGRLLDLEASPARAAGQTGGWEMALGLLALWVFNSVMIGAHLAQHTAGGTSFRMPVRLLRRFLAGAPLVGLFTVPGWQGFLSWRGSSCWQAPRPAFAGVSARSHRSNRLPRRIRQSLLGSLRSMEPGVAIGVILVVNFAAAMVVGYWLPAAESPALATTGFAFYRLCGCATTLVYAVAEMRKAGGPGEIAALRIALSLVWLLPLPGAGFLSLLAHLILELLTPQARESSLSQGAWIGRRNTGALVSWRGLLDGVRAGWRQLSPRQRRGVPAGVEPAIEAGTRDRNLRLFVYGRFSMLFLEAGALSWGLLRACRGWSVEGARRSEAALGALEEIALCLAACGLVSSAVQGLRQRRRRDPSGSDLQGPLSPAALLAASQFALASGLALGKAIAAGDRTAVGEVLTMAAGIPALWHTTRLLFAGADSREGVRFRQMAAIVFSSMGIWAMNLARAAPRPAISPGGAPGLILLLGLVVGPLVGSGGCRWLLAPEVPAGAHPPSASWRRKALFASAVLPLGSLASPLWRRLGDSRQR